MIRIIRLYIRILYCDILLIITDGILKLIGGRKVKFVNFEGKYRIYELSTGNYIVKDESGKTVYITRGESSARDWCKRH